MLYADHNDDRLWNPMAEDYLSERNTYHVDVDDPGVATVGYSKLCCYDVFDRGLGANCGQSYQPLRPQSLLSKGKEMKGRI